VRVPGRVVRGGRFGVAVPHRLAARDTCADKLVLRNFWRTRVSRSSGRRRVLPLDPVREANACSSPPSIAMRPRVAGRSPMRGASLPATAEARRRRRRNAHPVPRAVRFECSIGVVTTCRYSACHPTSGGRSSSRVRVSGRVVRRGCAGEERWRAARHLGSIVQRWRTDVFKARPRALKDKPDTRWRPGRPTLPQQLCRSR
jgi:hypothetical protein